MSIGLFVFDGGTAVLRLAVSLVRFDPERSQASKVMMRQLMPWYPVVTLASLLCSSGSLLFFVVPQLQATIATYVSNGPLFYNCATVCELC
jgi:type II secretory pathway component PulF